VHFGDISDKFARAPDFERDVAQAVTTFWHRSGRGEEAKMVDRASKEELFDFIHASMPKPEVLQKIVDDVRSVFQKSPSVCASCGMLCLNYVAHPVASLPKELFRAENPHHCQTCVKYGADWLLLYPRGVSGDDAKFCDDCESALQKNEASKFSLAGGTDYGVVPDALKNLSLLERVAMARVRPFLHTVKLTPKGGLRLDGHVIAFEHDAPSAISSVLPNNDLDSSIAVMFVGTAEDFRRNRRDVLAYEKLYNLFRVDTHKIVAGLSFLSQENAFYKDITVDESRLQHLEKSRDSILDATHVTSEASAILDAFVTSDVASGRPHVDTEEEGVQSDDATRHSDVDFSFVHAPPEPAEANVLQTLHELLTTSAAPVEGDPKPVFSIRADAPVNEFTLNDQLVYKMFPNLFPLGKGLKTAASVSAAQLRHLMLFHDARFAKELDLVFLLSNQLVRHENIRNVSLKVAGKQDKRDGFLQEINTPEAKAELKAAADDCADAEAQKKLGFERPLRPETLKLLRRYMKHLRVGSRGLKQGPISREKCLSELRALCVYFGLPSLFVTLAPSDVDNELLMRFACESSGEDFEIRLPDLKNKQVRTALASDNPIFAAKVFQKVFDVVVGKLYGLSMVRSSSEESRRSVVDSLASGIFGVVLGHYAVIEAQARGTLHFHQLVWTKLNPSIFEAALQSKETIEALRQAIDSMVCCDVGEETVEKHPVTGRMNQVVEEFAERSRNWDDLREIPIFSVKETDDYGNKTRWWERSILGALHGNMHSHRKTCTKGSGGKRYKCRMGMPLGAWEYATGPVLLSFDEERKFQYAPLEGEHSYRPTSVLDFVASDIIVWECHRLRHQVYISPFNRFLMNLTMSNQNIQLLGAPSQCRGAIYYVCSYCCKDANVLSSALVCLNEALQHCEAYPSTHAEVAKPRNDPDAESPVPDKEVFERLKNTEVTILEHPHPLKVVSAEERKTVDYKCGVCGKKVKGGHQSFRCDECEFDACAHCGSVRAVRTFKHLMQRWLNNVSARCETSSQQAAAMLLGDDPAQSSESFWWCFPDAAIRLLKASDPELFENHDPEKIYQEVGGDDNVGGDPEAVVYDVWNGEDVSREDGEDDGGGDAVVAVNGRVSSFGQDWCYAHCPFRSFVSLYEFTGIFDVEKVGEAEVKDRQKPGSRLKNLQAPFDRQDGVLALHSLRLRSKHAIPVLSGRVPVHPGVPPRCAPTEAAWLSWSKRAETWAHYCAVTFLPWNSTTRKIIEEGFQGLDGWARRVIAASRAGDPSVSVDRARLGAMMAATQGLLSKEHEKKLCSLFRYRNTDDFSLEEYKSLAEVDRVTGGLSTKPCAPEMVEILREIANLDMNAKECELNAASAKFSTGFAMLHGAEAPSAKAPGGGISISNTSGTEVEKRLEAIRNSERDSDLGHTFDEALRSARPPPEPRAEDPASAGDGDLNAGQKEVLEKLISLIRSKKQVLQIVQGGPGTGKTYLANRLIETCNLRVKRGAFTGIAASLINGKTLHSLFGLSRKFSDGVQDMGKLAKNQQGSSFGALKEQFRGIDLVLIDEISQLTAKMLDEIDRKCRVIKGNKFKPFGGIHFVLCGDFVQLPPVGADGLYKVPGIIFPKFGVNVLLEQMRSKTDERHTSNQNKMRAMEGAFPVRGIDLSLYKTLDANDVRSGGWGFATHVVVRNKLRRCINYIQAQRWCASRGTPFITWNVDVPSVKAAMSEEGLKRLWGRMPKDSDSIGIYAQDAPCILTSNINPELGICNGTQATMDSLCFYDKEKQRALLERIASAVPGEEIHLCSPPDAIFVRIGCGDQAVVVPIIEGSDKVKIRGKEIKCWRHMVELGFACTYHKVQGRTIPEGVILHLTNLKRNEVYSMFLVGISRVNMSSQLRLFNPTESELQVVRDAVPDEHLRKYMERINKGK